MSITNNGKKEVMFKKVPSIKYLIQIKETQEQVKALLNSNSEVNTINSNYA